MRLFRIESILLFALLMLTFTAATSAAPKKNHKYQSAKPSLPAHYHRDISIADYKAPFSTDILVAIVGGKPCVKFEGYSPVSSHESSFTAPASFINANTLSFTFIDSWGSKGKGRLVLKHGSVVASFKLVESSPSGMNAGESWPNNGSIPQVSLDAKTLPKKCCNPN